MSDRRLVRMILAVGLLAVVPTGCTTSRRYRMVKENTAPPAALNLGLTVSKVTVRVDSVIVYRGPGSWKQEALWDEYRVTVVNDGTGVLLLEAFALLDPIGVLQEPGTDPWRLEKRSETNWQRYARVGELVLGAGAAVGVIELSAIGYGLTGGTVAGLFFIVPAVVVADVAVVAWKNHSNRVEVEKEFSRRRLVFPRTLAGGESVTGSLFFPMVPAPQRLVLQGRVDGVPLELSLDLRPLAGLHLAPEKRK